MSGVLKGVYAEARAAQNETAPGRADAKATTPAAAPPKDLDPAKAVRFMSPEQQAIAEYEAERSGRKKADEIPAGLQKILTTPENNPAMAAILGEGQERGRPKGKRSDPNYERMTVLLRKETRHKIELKMLQDRNGPKDLSELAEMLFSAWVESPSS